MNIYELIKITYSGVGSMGPLLEDETLGLFLTIKRAKDAAQIDCKSLGYKNVLRWEKLLSQEIGMIQYKIKIVKAE
jgi:hypothetical protein